MTTVRSDSPGAAPEVLGAEILSRHETPHALDVNFGGCVIRVLSNDESLRDVLADYYAEFVSDGGTPEIVIRAIEAPPPDFGLPLRSRGPEAGKRKIKEEWHESDAARLVRKRLTGMQFLFSHDFHLAVGPCGSNVNQVVNFINNRHIQHLLHRGGLLLHASGIADGDAGVAICGFSGMGKSTLALHLVADGTDFVSNDRIVLRPEESGPRMYGIAKLPRINPGTIVGNPHLHPLLSPAKLDEYRSMEPAALWSLEEKHDADLVRCFGPGRFGLDAPMRALVILNWQRDGGAFRAREIDPAARPDLFPAYSKSTGLFYQPPPGTEGCGGTGEEEGAVASEADYHAALRGCRVFEFSGGADFQAAVRFCRSLTSGGESV